MTWPLEDYGLIGDGKTAALVCRNGSIDWLCLPRFDSDACLAALLGDAGHGRWQLCAADPTARITRRYRADTMILETDFETATGTAQLIDFMPVGNDSSSVVRLVAGLDGTVEFGMALNLRFDYGQVRPWIEPTGDGFVARIGPDLAVLRAPVAIEAGPHVTTAGCSVCAGERLPFVLSYGLSNRPVPAPFDPEVALAATEKYWRGWIGRFDKPCDWPDAVRRSLLTLRALVHQPTGGVVAAPTTSLPERPGGAMNWDYRYCWLRDATFTLSAFLNAGYHDEARAWRDWILRAIAAEPEKLQIMYRVDGARHIAEHVVESLPGYAWTRPVRIGNSAAYQRQIDVYGELVDLMQLAERAGLEASPHGRQVEQAIVDHIEQVWRMPGQGLWEARGEPRHYTYSRVMAWVGLDCFLRGATPGPALDQARRRQLHGLRRRIHDEICREGYHAGLGTFVQHYGGQELDASLLLLPLVQFLPVEDPRMARTIAAIERDLMDDGLVLRRRQKGSEPEGAFLACTCWLADCRALQGRTGEAREALERILAVRSDLGLLSEEYDIRGRHLSGNFPQALTHLAVVNTALGLCGPVLQRGGG